MTAGAPTLGGLRRLSTVTLRNLNVTGTLTTTGSITDNSDIILADGKALKTDTTTAHTALLQAYDVDGTAYKTFGTLTNGNTPSFAIAAPSGGTVAIDGATIGGVTPAAGTFTTVAGIGTAQVARTSGAVTANGTITYANVTGLSQTVVPGTYQFVVRLPSTVASGTGGIKYCFNYTTTVVSVLEATGRGFTASAVAVQHTTTTTTQTDLFTQAGVVIYAELSGTMVITTGGTIDVQVAQNTSNASNTVALVGGSFELMRIA